MDVKKSILTVLLIALIASFIWAETPFYEDLNQAQRYQLSQAYLAVSEHFKDMGQENRATEYRRVADQILTSLESAPPVEPMAEAQESTETSTAETTVEERTQRAIMYYFNKLGSSLSMGNVERTMSGLSFPFTAGGYSLSEERVEKDLMNLTENYTFSLEYWDMENPVFTREGEAVVLTLDTTIDDPGIFLFWNDPQSFVFVPADRGWKLAEIR